MPEDSHIETIRTVQDLLGRLIGVLSDDDVNAAEIKSLQDYIKEHPYIELAPPFSSFANFLNNFENTVHLDRQIIKDKARKYLEHMDLLYQIHSTKSDSTDIEVVFKGMLKGIMSDHEINLMELNDLFYLYSSYEDLLAGLKVEGMMKVVESCIAEDEISPENEKVIKRFIEALI